VQQVNDLRLVAISADQIELLEEIGQDLVRQRDARRGLMVLALCLAWRSVGQPVGMSPFACGEEDVDESAGVAEVIELHAHSRRVDP
jgi:hypothetical protein